jgi:hypothetical protein
MVVMKTFGLRRDEVTEGWKKMHNEELPNLYSLPSIIRMTHSMKMRWAGHEARMGIQEFIKGIGRKARRKETTRKNKKSVGGYC